MEPGQRVRVAGGGRPFATLVRRLGVHGEVWYIVGAYVLLSGLWILFSDRLVAFLFREPDAITRVSMFKGFFFVVVTGGLLYVLITRLALRLQRAKDDWERTFDAVPDLIAILDHDRRILHVNRAMAAKLGVEPDACQGRRCSELMHGEAQPPWFCPVDLLKDDGREHAVEIHEARLNSDLMVTVTPLAGGNGRGGGILHIARDITERRQAEEALRRSEEKFSKAFQGGPVVISMSSSDTHRFVEVNRAFELATGYARDEVVGRTATDLGLWADPEALARANRAVLCEGGYQNLETVFRTKRGELRVGIVSGELIEFGGERVVMSVANDITDRKRVEAEANRLVTAVEQAAEAVIVTDTEARIQYVNPAFTKITGYARDEVVGENTRILQSGRHDRSFYEELWKTLRAGEVWVGHFVNKRKDGSIYEVECTISPVRDPGGDVINYVALTRDVTHELELERQLRQAQKMEAVGTLAGGIAHDFNNILQSILGYVDLAKDGVAAGGTAESSLDEIVAASERARHLIGRLLAFSRQTEQEHKPLRLQRSVAEALRLLRSSLPATIEIRQDLSETVRPVLGDPSLFHQVIMNLCTNAYHAMREEGGVLDIRLDEMVLDADAVEALPGLPLGAYARLTVADTGCGMDESTRKRVFDPYFTTKKPGEGTGLGLSVVHGIVKDLAGTILLSSEPGKGTSFTVLLPVSRVASSVAEPVAREADTLLCGTERILLVDDEVSVTKSMGSALRRYGYAVEACNDSQQAHDLFAADPARFDLVVTDQTMPGLSGIQLITQLRAVRGDIPTVLCTGYSDLIDEARATELGIRAFLAKPFMAKALAQTIRSALDRNPDGSASARALV